MHALWTALFAVALAVLLTAPARSLGAAFLCGAAGMLVQDGALALDVRPSWATALAATAVAVVATRSAHRQGVHPVIMVTGLLPLGASSAVFQALVGLGRLAAGEDAAADVAVHASRAFVTFLSVAVGAAAGVLVARVLVRGLRRPPA
ncbi:MAG TPA: threonine/serine exporter family protein [Candidatus Polarisedimenticolaceae bacterium]|nr:threonine/serine exporter family protein [Candidatus Polarisedimenticolaceae bacterium]